MIDYPSREELSFIDCPYDQFNEPYNAMIKNRQNKIIEKFVKLMIAR